MIDIGGTPANLLAKDKFCLLQNKELVAILDPFDIARNERTILLTKSEGKIKVPIIFDADEAVSAEKARVDIAKLKEKLNSCNISSLFPDFDKERIESRYEQLKEIIVKTAENSSNLREFMNSLYLSLIPREIKAVELEKFLAENKDYALYLAEKYKFKIRIFCDCGKIIKFEDYNLDSRACCMPVKEAIKKGRYIPEGAFFRLIIMNSGITPSMSKESEYLQRTLELCRLEGIEPKICFIGEAKNTMCESYLLGGEKWQKTY